MPIFDITIVLKSGEILSDVTASRLADAAGLIFKEEAGRCWVKLLPLDKRHYAENGVAEADMPYPGFVEVLQFHEETVERRASLAIELAKSFGGVLDRNLEHVHIEFCPAAKNRIAFGGKLRTESDDC